MEKTLKFIVSTIDKRRSHHWLKVQGSDHFDDRWCRKILVCVKYTVQTMQYFCLLDVHAIQYCSLGLSLKVRHTQPEELRLRGSLELDQSLDLVYLDLAGICQHGITTGVTVED